MSIQIELTPEVLKEIHYHRYNHPAPLVQRRMEAIWLKGHKVPQAHIASLETHFRENPPASIKEAQSEIETITGVKRSETPMAEFLKKNSISVAEK